MSVIQVEHLTFGYENSPEYVFEDLSFRLDTDWKLGLVARNGKGKTTLLRIFMGELEYKGYVHIPAELEYFPQKLCEPGRLTLDIVEETDPQYELWKVCRECSLLELDAEVLYRPFDTLSSGERTKVLLAVLFAKESAFLLIDEPTNHLDREARTLIGNYLKRKQGFILVSHDRALLDACVDHVMVLNRQDMEIRQGNFSAWWKDKQDRDAFERRKNEKLQKDINRLESSARQSRIWADRVEGEKIGKDPLDSHFNISTRAYYGEKSRKMQMRRKNLQHRQEKAIDEKKTLLKNVEEPEALKLMPLEHRREVLAEAKGCVLAYRYKTCMEANFLLTKGEKVFLEGRNGCGKTSLLKAVLKAAEESFFQEGKAVMLPEGYREKEVFPEIIQGSLVTAANLKISYVPQDASFLRGSLRTFAGEQGIEETVFFTLLRKLDFSREQLEKNMEEYSAGQKKKVLLAQSLCQRAHLYIWDEPLNYIDVFSRIQIEEVLKHSGLTLLAVEHDEAFCSSLGGRRIRL